MRGHILFDQFRFGLVEYMIPMGVRSSRTRTGYCTRRSIRRKILRALRVPMPTFSRPGYLVLFQMIFPESRWLWIGQLTVIRLLHALARLSDGKEWPALTIGFSLVSSARPSPEKFAAPDTWLSVTQEHLKLVCTFSDDYRRQVGGFLSP